MRRRNAHIQQWYYLKVFRKLGAIQSTKLRSLHFLPLVMAALICKKMPKHCVGNMNTPPAEAGGFRLRL